MDFAQLGVDEDFCMVLKKAGITDAMPIQEKCMTPIAAGRDVLAQAETGSGKTLAFLLPVLAKLDAANPAVQCLIMTPTRELALQITTEAKKLAEVKSLGVLPVYGGRDINGELKKLKRGAQVVIATPGRLLDHLERQTINLGKLQTLVLDEADEMLLMGFKNEVEEVLHQMPRHRQLLCFSATLDKSVKKLAYRYMREPVEITIKQKTVTLANIKQWVVESPEPLKREALCAVLDEDRAFMAIIFCRTKRRVEELADYLEKKGYDCARLHSDVPQSKRERIMKTFRKGDLPYLVATDVAARGLDITGVTHIYNYDLPETVEDYIHRIGRTGRVGEDGETCLFITAKERRALAGLEQAIGMAIPKRTIVRN